MMLMFEALMVEALMFAIVGGTLGLALAHVVAAVLSSPLAVQDNLRIRA